MFTIENIKLTLWVIYERYSVVIQRASMHACYVRNLKRNYRLYPLNNNQSSFRYGKFEARIMYDCNIENVLCTYDTSRLSGSHVLTYP